MTSNSEYVELAERDPQTFDRLCEVYGLDPQDVIKRSGQAAVIATVDGQLD